MIMNRNELTTSERANRIILGAVLILVAMLTPTTPLGWIAVLPLVGTLPVFAGIFGFDPVSGFIRKEIQKISRALHHGGGHHPHHG